MGFLRPDLSEAPRISGAVRLVAARARNVRRELDKRSLIGETGSSQDRLIDVAGHVRQTEMAALEFISKPGMVDAEAMENGGLNIVNRDGIGDSVIGIII